MAPPSAGCRCHPAAPHGTRLVYMLTVWLPMCSTVVLMARQGGEDLTGDDSGQRLTSVSTCIHVLGA